MPRLVTTGVYVTVPTAPPDTLNGAMANVADAAVVVEAEVGDV
jgi:hypothetical protein